MRRTLLITALALTLTGAAAATAGATFPGENGPILYRNLDFDSGFGKPLLSAQPDGGGASVLDRRLGGFSDWRADGERLAIELLERDGDVQIATMDPDGGGRTTLTSGRGIHEMPSWSPSGRRIVFDYSPDSPEEPGFETRLWTMRADGSRARPLPMRRPGFDTEPRYSPDGRFISFARLRPPAGKRDWRSAIMVVPARAGRVRRLTRFGEFGSHDYAEHATWSPDGKWILFNLAPDGTIQAVRPNGRERRTIVPARPGFGGHKPAYSPDGTRIVFMCETQGTRRKPRKDHNEDICVMDADGSDIVNITNTPKVFENWPSWGPAAASDG
jgi:Tol biopolymer transport system component